MTKNDFATLRVNGNVIYFGNRLPDYKGCEAKITAIDHVEFIINDQRFNVSIRNNQLRVSVDGQIVVKAVAANVVTIDVESYSRRTA